MTTGQRSGFDPPDSFYIQVGVLTGRVDSLEDRVTRHEIGVKGTLDAMDRKLDDIQTSIDKQSGGVAWVSTIGKWSLWLIGGIASAAAAWRALWGHG